MVEISDLSLFFYLIMSKKFLGLLALVVGFMATVGVTQSLAYRGDFSAYGPNHTEERKVDMDTVMEEKDYEGWVSLLSEDGRNPGVLSKVDTQEEFDRFAQAYQLAKEGKVDEANAIRSELGLGNGQQSRNGGQNRGGRFLGVGGDGVCGRTE